MESPASLPDANAGPTRTTAWQWLSVTVLALATFVVVTSEMLPIGVLTPMADGLGISRGAAGSSLTVTGLVAAVAAPTVPRLLGALDRRVVLAAAMVVVAAGNALTAVADDFGLLVVARVILGIGMGAVWGLASAVAPRLVAPRNAALAVSLAIGGVAAASVVGVPLGTLVSNAFGWRAAFGALAVCAVALAAALLLALPRLPRPSAPTVAADGADAASPLRIRPVRVGLVLILFLVSAHFAAYTYARPVLEERTGLTPGAIAAFLLVYGLFGLVGNFAAGALAARRARGTVLALTVGVGAAIALLALFGRWSVPTGVGIALWGVAYGGLSVAGQIWMTRSAPHRVEQVTGIYVGVFTAAIALGAFLGGTVVEAFGITALLWSAAGLTAAALVVGLLGGGRTPSTNPTVLTTSAAPGAPIVPTTPAASTNTTVPSTPTALTDTTVPSTPTTPTGRKPCAAAAPRD
ncbi:MFS transporter [Streptomyces sp. NPDC047315]|uniref:MFS transporter n=1 Tax=Streptomyces sp. NPDC047315 TaxID=3155142 RepID=UPI0033C62809